MDPAELAPSGSVQRPAPNSREKRWLPARKCIQLSRSDRVLETFVASSKKSSGGAKAAAEAAPAPVAEKAPLDLTQLKVEKSCSRGLATWLSTNRVSLAVSSYQTGRVYL